MYLHGCVDRKRGSLEDSVSHPNVMYENTWNRFIPADLIIQNPEDAGSCMHETTRYCDEITLEVGISILPETRSHTYPGSITVIINVPAVEK